jgi:hypothetical protein
MFLQCNPRRHHSKLQHNSIESKRNPTSLPLLVIDTKKDTACEKLSCPREIPEKRAARKTKHSQQTKERHHTRENLHNSEILSVFVDKKIIQKVLEGLLSKPPKHEHEKAFDKSTVCPVPHRLGSGVFCLDGPAVGPSQKMPEEDVEETLKTC